MNEYFEIFTDCISDKFVSAVLSNPRTKEQIVKVKVRPVIVKDTHLFQLESFTRTQAFHENLKAEDAIKRLSELMLEFKQAQIVTRDEEISILVSKKGKPTVKRKKTENKEVKINLSHNRIKNYIINEGTPVPFLVDLGVMTSEGKIVRSRMDKFKQINRFLEFIEDILPALDKDRELTILDFGCGKSYLTFAMYYYLHEMKKYDIQIIGLDLKRDVINRCNVIAKSYGYEKLHFLVGDIADYEGVDQVDMVVTLHACDTATDYALAKAIGWNAKVILSVPCCQHELNKQMKNDTLAPLMEYGLIKERMAALVTDALRAKYLEYAGYETQVLEFIDMEHTPKNILLRAVWQGVSLKKQEAILKEIAECQSFLAVEPTLGKLLLK